MLHDIFSLQVKLRNHRYVFGYGTEEKYQVTYYTVLGILFILLLIWISIMAINKTLQKLASRKLI